MCVGTDLPARMCCRLRVTVARIEKPSSVTRHDRGSICERPERLYADRGVSARRLIWSTSTATALLWLFALLRTGIALPPASQT